MCIKTRLKCN